MDEAVEEFEEALRFNPEDAMSNQNLEGAFKKKGLEEKDSRGELS